MSLPIRASTTLALVLALPFWLGGPAQAVPVSFTFSGVFDNVSPDTPIAKVGLPFSGGFEYESSTPATPESGVVTHPSLPGVVVQRGISNALTHFVVRMRTEPPLDSFFTVLSSPSGADYSVFIDNFPAGSSPSGRDFLTVQAAESADIRSFACRSGPNPTRCLTSVEHPTFALAFVAKSASLFGPDNAIIPLASVDLSRVDVLSQLDPMLTRLEINFGEPSMPLIASGSLNTLEPVPEPTTLLLFGTTMAGLGLARWRAHSASHKARPRRK
jgi:PEP-CTERM motif